MEGPVHSLVRTLAWHPLLMVALILGAGHLCSRISPERYGPVSSSVCLLLALAASLTALHVAGVRLLLPDPLVGAALVLFSATLGLRIGPPLLALRRAEATTLIVLVLVMTGTAFAITMVGGVLAGLPAGTGVGVLAGSHAVPAVFAFLLSTGAGSATRLASAASPAEIDANAVTTFVLVSLVSMLRVAALARVLPRLLVGSWPGAAPPPRLAAADTPVTARVYRLENPDFAGRPVREVVERLFVPVLALARDRATVPLDGNPVLHLGDILTVETGATDQRSGARRLGPEVADDRTLTFDDMGERRDVVVLPGRAVGVRLDELRRLHGGTLIIHTIVREGLDVPVIASTRLARHDLIGVSGAPADLQAFVRAVGVARSVPHTDRIGPFAMTTAAGYLAGLLADPHTAGSVPIGPAIGVLAATAGLGLWRALRPLGGRVLEEPVRRVAEKSALDVLMIAIAFGAAPVLAAQGAGGASPLLILLVGALTAVVPTALAWVVGDRLLHVSRPALASIIAGVWCTLGDRASARFTTDPVGVVASPVAAALAVVLFLTFAGLGVAFW